MFTAWAKGLAWAWIDDYEEGSRGGVGKNGADAPGNYGRIVPVWWGQCRDVYGRVGV